jgi:hypothetical protein
LLQEAAQIAAHVGVVIDHEDIRERLMAKRRCRH